MADFNFQQFEAIIREAVDPEIQRQFAESGTLYKRFTKDLHPWTKPDGLTAYTQLMRGEIELPHTPTKCSICMNAFEQQLAALRSVSMQRIDYNRRSNFPGIGKRSGLSLSSRRKEIAMKLRELVSKQLEKAA